MNSAALHGFSHDGDRTTFVFSPALYRVAPVTQVAVTGDFRAWSLDHEHGRWQLHPDPTDGLWKLVVWNPGFSQVPLGAQFKFMLNEGSWIHPMPAVPNQANQNFVFFGEQVLPSLRAELETATGIALRFTSLPRSLNPADYTILSHSGTSISVVEVLPRAANDLLLVPAVPIDIKRVHYVVARFETEVRAVFCRFDGWWRSLYASQSLGATPSPTETTFRVFAPRATAINLYLYPDYQPNTPPASTHALRGEPNGTWTITLPGNLSDTWYDFTAHGPAEPGSMFYEQVPVHLSDPYARANAECWGRSLVVGLPLPPTLVRVPHDKLFPPGRGLSASSGRSFAADLRQKGPERGIHDGTPSSGKEPVVSSEACRTRPGVGVEQANSIGEALPPFVRPAIQNVIAYEVHTEDFTLDLPVPEEEKGTFVAFARKGLKNSLGVPVGLDHLLALGINTVHLLPVQEFLHYPENTWKETFEGDAFMAEQGVDKAYYEWGYRTSHAFAIENTFRRKGDPHGAERAQFRHLVDTLHAEGLAVIVDIVPNHTAENMDGKPGKGGYVLHWNGFDSLYHYRWLAPELEFPIGVDATIIPAQMEAAFKMYGEYGNEVKFEDRPMVQRWLIDQCRMLMDEFGVDGFRVDLGGQVDKQTLHKLRQALGPDAILYGEPWIGSYDPEFEANPAWDWYKFDAPITWFNDGARNAFKGGTGNPADPARDRGYAGGKADERGAVILGLSKGFHEDYTPTSSINYLDIHDNWALADQFGLNNWDGRLGVDEYRVKLAATLLLTSPGPVVIHGGTELLRSKGLAALRETIKLLPHPQFPDQGPVEVHFHGKRDTYNMRAANVFRWETAGRALSPEFPCDYAGMTAFWQGLLALRNSPLGQLFRLTEHPKKDHYQWFGPEEHTLGYLLGGQLMVILNVHAQPDTLVTPVLPAGTWRLIGTLAGFALSGITDDDPTLLTLAGGHAHVVYMPGASLRVWATQTR